MIKNIRLISAGAGSGKTYRLTDELLDFIQKKGVRPNAVIATTFTKLAAKELSDRVQKKLIKKGVSQKIALELRSSLIGTVNGICGALLADFCYEGGISPNVKIIAEEDEEFFLSQALSSALSLGNAQVLETLSAKLGIEDYSKYINDMMKKARSNNITPQALKKQSKISLNEQLSYLEKKSKKEPEKLTSDFLKTLKSALSKYDESVDTTKGTADYFSRVKKVIHSLEEGLELPWSEWIAFCKNKATKKSEHLSDLIQEEAMHVYSHPSLHADIEKFINTAFEVSSDVLTTYQDYKAKRALMDFVDQEALLLNLLENNSVQEKIKERFDLLMIDEFQDTSPIQLAIFLKIASLVKYCVMVGDPKQSIYSFRGADPELMKAVLSKLPPIKDEDIQDTSYRSRPELVEGANKIFSEAFRNSLLKKHIVLKPIRTDEKNAPSALKQYDFIKSLDEGKQTNKDNVSENLAQEIYHFLQDLKSRKIKAGDIAILMRQNDECLCLASYLTAHGLKVALATNALLDTPEGKLVLACLKLLLNQGDQLSKAEIQILSSNDGDSSKVLNERLMTIGTNNPESHPLILTINKLREEIINLTPLEIFDQLVLRTRLDQYVGTWERKDKRLQNLISFRKHFESYQERCLRLNMAATLPGLVLYLSNLNDSGKDTQAESRGADAISILTYHRSKGLEWPVVFLASLDSKLKTREYGVSAIGDFDKFDPENPLEGRYIRLGLNPFGKQCAKTTYEENLKASAIYTRFKNEAEEEDKRLFYVGYTRARDELIFVTTKNNDSWPKRVCPSFTFPEDKKEITLSKDIIYQAKSKKSNVKYFPIIESDTTFKKRNTSPSDFISKEGEYKINLSEQISYGTRIKMKGKIDDNLLGDAIHHMLCLGPDADLDQLMKNHSLESIIDKDSFLENRKAFFNYLKTFFGDYTLKTEIPMKFNDQGQIMSGIADMILETKDGLVLIDHKTFQGTDILKHSEKYKGQLWAYQKMAEGKFKKVFLNYFMQGIFIGQ